MYPEENALRDRRLIGTRADGRYQLIRREDLPDKLPRRTRNVPPRHLWPRLNIPAKHAPTCKECGRSYKAVSTQGAITYYRSRCRCGSRTLKKVERPIDWQLLLMLFIVDDVSPESQCNADVQ